MNQTAIWMALTQGYGIVVVFLATIAIATKAEVGFGYGEHRLNGPAALTLAILLWPIALWWICTGENES